MSTAPNTVLTGAARAKIVNQDGTVSYEWLKVFQQWATQLQNGLNQIGEILASTRIQGRTEGIGTTASQLNSSGDLLSTDSIAADGTGSPLTGGQRAFVGFDSNSQLAGTFHNNPINTQGTFTGANPLSQVGVTTTIAIAANTQQFGEGQVSYNSGSVDPGSLGLWYIYADDPTFSGGAVSYQFTNSLATLNAADGRVSFGQITTLGGGGGAGSGGGGGCPLSGAPVSTYGDAAWWTMRLLPCSEFIRIRTETGRNGIFSKNHRAYQRRGLLPLTEWLPGDYALTEDGEERVTEVEPYTLVDATVDSYEASRGHIYAAWGFISHNVKPI